MKRLPIGISDFRELIKGNYVYVDKTKYIYELVSSSKYVFLSRPRRFGKSLLLSTIEYLYESKRELFNGLYIENKWNWDEKYPVIRVDFSVDIREYKGVYNRIEDELEINYKKYKIKEDKKKDGIRRFRKLIMDLSEKYNKQVVVLIDEYDKPILDLIEDKKQAEEVRKILKEFYSVLKGLDKYLRFVLVTGVSKFAKVSLFSGLNQLKDISLDKRYGDICGYTQSELENYFKEYLRDVNIEEVREWYNGYNFLSDKVYNPFDVLLYLDKKEIRNYWYETGRTEFLFKIIKQRNFDLPYLYKRYYTEEILEKFDIEYISIEAIMFQTGYLTIKEIEKLGAREVYTLDYPNREVREAFNNELLFYITRDYKQYITKPLELALIKENLEEIRKQIEVFINSISYEVLKNEYVYAAAIYGLVYATGYNVIIEDNTSKGRIDLTIIVNKKVVYIIEFKVLENKREKGRALKQIKNKEYFKKYLNYERIYLVGIEFEKINKNLVNFEYEVIGGKK
ncbi:MAG: ATP-binding protein [bacterium]|nr:ATP-binding protein [bacterium]